MITLNIPPIIHFEEVAGENLFEAFWKGMEVAYRNLIAEVITHIPGCKDKSEIGNQLKNFYYAYYEFFFNPPREIIEDPDFGEF
jgi:hypothetical protein